ncbi:MAG: hypothetical protein IID40_08750, partial [Planctomycetes bacterium]|nr:hypothetical protein [Planctomycetota bacterium]
MRIFGMYVVLCSTCLVFAEKDEKPPPSRDWMKALVQTQAPQPASGDEGDGSMPYGMLTAAQKQELYESTDLEADLRRLGYTDFPDRLAPFAGRPTDVDLIWYGSLRTSTEIPMGPLQASTDIGWGEDASNNQAVNFVLNTPGVLNSVGPTSAVNFLGAGDFGPGGAGAGFMYVLDSSTTSSSLFTMSLTTGALTTVGPSLAGPGENWTGMAWDATTGNMYASAAACGTSSSLYTINLATGAKTLVGGMTGSACSIAIAVDCTGQLYGYDIVTDTFGTVNKATGAYSPLASLSFDANFGQGLGYDHQEGVMYMAAFNATVFQAELRTVDLTTGVTTLVGALGIPGTSQLGFMSVDQDPGPCPTGACCEDSTGICLDGIPGDMCPGRFVADTLCVDIVPLCGQVAGACCFGDGSCAILTPADCSTQGGNYSGDNTSCTPNLCPQPCLCGAPISTFPYNEDFEGEPTCGTSCGNACVLVGDWTNETDDDFDWTADAGGTGSTATGPDTDANPGTSSGIYLYTETSGTGCQNSEAIVTSPCFDVSSLTTPQLVFAYHMFGVDIVELNAEVSTDNCLTWNTEFTIVGEQQGTNDPWEYAVVDLGDYSGETNLRIRFRGVTGGSFNGDMAIDDITVQESQDFTGACCTGATCAPDKTEADCLAGGGTYLGDFSNCGPPNPCTVGCCLPSGLCADLTVGECASSNGASQGAGTSCLTDPCPPINDTCDTSTTVPSVPFFTTVDNSL